MEVPLNPVILSKSEMQLTPSDIYLHYNPSECDLRVYLKHQGVVGAEPSPYAEVVKSLG